MIFHLVSRLHRKENWFVPELRWEIARLIRRMIERTDARLLAYAVMPNHLHIVLRQGESTLGTVMQPLMRSVALRVQRFHHFEGTVVERRYRHRACHTAAHVRAAIIYTHLNPWRAGLCRSDLDYPWTTHQAYLPGIDPERFGMNPYAQLTVLYLFAQTPAASRDALCRDYLKWLDWRMDENASQREIASSFHERPIAAIPDPRLGRRAWKLHFAPYVIHEVRAPRAKPQDLRDFVSIQLAHAKHGGKIEDLHGPRLPHYLARLRADVIRAAAENRFKTGELASFFGVSPPTISRAKFAGRSAAT